jgi:hypothetical protein
VTSGAAWLRHLVRGRESAAFTEESRLRFFWGFFQTRAGAYAGQMVGRLGGWNQRRPAVPSEQHPTRVR